MAAFDFKHKETKKKKRQGAIYVYTCNVINFQANFEPLSPPLRYPTLSLTPTLPLMILMSVSNIYLFIYFTINYLFFLLYFCNNMIMQPKQEITTY